MSTIKQLEEIWIKHKRDKKTQQEARYSETYASNKKRNDIINKIFNKHHLDDLKTTEFVYAKNCPLPNGYTIEITDQSSRYIVTSYKIPKSGDQEIWKDIVQNIAYNRDTAVISELANKVDFNHIILMTSNQLDSYIGKLLKK